MGILDIFSRKRHDAPADDARPAAAAPEVAPAPPPEPAAASELPADGALSAPEPAAEYADWNIGSLVAPPPPPPDDAVVVGPGDPLRTAELKPQVVDAISTVFDPEIPVNIYELGLIYDIIVDAASRVQVIMTLTSPACPSAQQLPSEVRYKVKALPGVADAIVDVVWEPPWSKERMSEAARLSLGLF